MNRATPVTLTWPKTIAALVFGDERVEQHRPGPLTASRTSSTTQLLTELAHHTHHLVRAGVASNPHTGEDTLAALRDDPHPHVRQTAATTTRERLRAHANTYPPHQRGHAQLLAETFTGTITELDSVLTAMKVGHQ